MKPAGDYEGRKEIEKMQQKQIDDLLITINWCNAYIEDFRKNGDFDPLSILTDTETPQQKLFGVCIDFETAIEKAIEDFTEARRKVRR